jgi:hypothetical protein
MILFISCIHFFLACEFIDVLGIYKIEKEDNQITQMTKLGAKYVMAYPNLFTHYE